MTTQALIKTSSTVYSSNEVNKNNLTQNDLFKSEIIKFVLNNMGGVENLSFFNQLGELEKLEWVLVHQEDYKRRYKDNEHSQHNMDIHFERQNQYGRHLLVGRYAYENNSRKCYYVGFYFRIESIENGILNYSYISFLERYQKMNDLKNSVAEYELKNNCYGYESESNYVELKQKYF